MWICAAGDEIHHPMSVAGMKKVKHLRLKSCLKQSADIDKISGNDTTSTQPDSVDRRYASTESTTTASSDRRGIRFHQIHIREYERIVGDNPSCSSGAPIGIGWAHGATRTMSLDYYESRKVIRRNQMQLVLSRTERQRLLLNWGASGPEVVDSIRANIRVKNQRRRTVNNLGTYDKLEETLENVSRKLKYVLLLQTPTSQVVKRLQSEHEKVARENEKAIGNSRHSTVSTISDKHTGASGSGNGSVVPTRSRNASQSGHSHEESLPSEVAIDKNQIVEDQQKGVAVMRDLSSSSGFESDSYRNGTGSRRQRKEGSSNGMNNDPYYRQNYSGDKNFDPKAQGETIPKSYSYSNSHQHERMQSMKGRGYSGSPPGGNAPRNVKRGPTSPQHMMPHVTAAPVQEYYYANGSRMPQGYQGQIIVDGYQQDPIYEQTSRGEVYQRQAPVGNSSMRRDDAGAHSHNSQTKIIVEGFQRLPQDAISRKEAAARSNRNNISHYDYNEYNDRLDSSVHSRTSQKSHNSQKSSGSVVITEDDCVAFGKDYKIQNSAFPFHAPRSETIIKNWD